MIERYITVPGCTVSVTLAEDLSKITVSKGQVTLLPYHKEGGGTAELTDDVEYEFPASVSEERNFMGYLVLVVETGELDVYVDELWRDARKLAHDWRFDTALKPVTPLFDVTLYKDKPGQFVVWAPKPKKETKK